MSAVDIYAHSATQRAYAVFEAGHHGVRIDDSPYRVVSALSPPTPQSSIRTQISFINASQRDGFESTMGPKQQGGMINFDLQRADVAHPVMPFEVGYIDLHDGRPALAWITTRRRIRLARLRRSRGTSPASSSIPETKPSPTSSAPPTPLRLTMPAAGSATLLAIATSYTWPTMAGYCAWRA